MSWLRPAPCRRLSFRPMVELLEARCVPTTNLILDFAGGSIPAGNDYLLVNQRVPGDPTTFANFPFQPFAAITAPGGPAGNREEQILYIVAGVRKDYEPFDVDVIWDDRGVHSPFFRPAMHDSVIYVVNNNSLELEPMPQPGEGNFGEASSVDTVELQQIVFDGQTTGGSYDVSFQGGPSVTIAANAAAAQVEDELTTLASIGANNASVVGGPGVAGGFANPSHPYDVTFQNGRGGQALPLLTIDDSNLQGARASVRRIYAGGANSRPDTAFVFEPASVAQDPNRPSVILRELIDTVSHEAGHTFGLSHSTANDAENRAIVALANVQPSNELDSRFSSAVLAHDDPEFSRPAYSEAGRLFAYLGARGGAVAVDHTGETLTHREITEVNGQEVDVAADATAIELTLGAGDSVEREGTIQFPGDRVAYEFTATVAGVYRVSEHAAAGSALDPVATVWDATGNFVAVGNVGALGGSSTLVFNGVAGQRYFVTAGSGYDRQTSEQTAANGGLAAGNTGVFTLTIGAIVLPAKDVAAIGKGTLTLANGTTVNLSPGTKVPVYSLLPLYAQGPLFPDRSPDVFTAYVTGLYHAILQRDPDPIGLAGWTDALRRGVSRDRVVRGFFDSVEHRGQEVDFYYQHFLGRRELAAERDVWIRAFQSGGTEASITLRFLSSAEYQLTHASSLDFVTGLYEDVLDRDPDAAGLAFWTQTLQAGRSRADVVRAFQDSTENYVNAVDGFYLAYLQRTADPIGSAGWLALLQRKQLGALEEVAVGFLGSSELVNQAAATVR